MALDDSDLTRIGGVVRLNVLEALQIHVSQDHAPLWKALDDSRERISYIEGRTNAGSCSSDAAKNEVAAGWVKMSLAGAPKPLALFLLIFILGLSVAFGIVVHKTNKIKAAVDNIEFIQGMFPW